MNFLLWKQPAIELGTNKSGALAGKMDHFSHLAVKIRI